MDAVDIANLESAVDALNDSDVEVLVALMSDDMDWRGASNSWLWWRRPS